MQSVVFDNSLREVECESKTEADVNEWNWNCQFSSERPDENIICMYFTTILSHHATWFFLQVHYQCLSSYSPQQLEGGATICLNMELFAQLQGGGFDSWQIQTLESWISMSPPRNLLAQLRYQCTAHCYRENIRIIYELYFPSWNSVFQLTPYKWNNTCKVQNCSLVT